MKKWFLLLCALLSLGWGPAKPLVQDAKFVLPPGQGAVMVSVTMTSVGLDDGPNAGLIIRDVHTSQQRVLTAYALGNRIRSPGSEPDGKGRLFVVYLPPGEYAVTNALGMWVIETDMRERQYVNIPRNDRFTVAEGRVTYLGNYTVNLNLQPDVVTADTRKRDLFHAQDAWGVTDTSNIDFRLVGVAS